MILTLRSENTEVYNLICESIGIKALPNNGTLHLPLKSVGLHSDFDDEPFDAMPEVKSNAALPSATDEAILTGSHWVSGGSSTSTTEPAASGNADIPFFHDDDDDDDDDEEEEEEEEA